MSRIRIRSRAAARAVEAILGPINICVNNARTAVLTTIKELTAQEFKRVLGGFAAPRRL
jgi:NAD(P)-dependent dehydrogenase (short-subunit alcohol dehydrogenase family)